MMTICPSNGFEFEIRNGATAHLNNSLERLRHSAPTLLFPFLHARDFAIETLGIALARTHPF